MCVCKPAGNIADAIAEGDHPIALDDSGLYQAHVCGDETMFSPVMLKPASGNLVFAMGDSREMKVSLYGDISLCTLQ